MGVIRSTYKSTLFRSLALIPTDANLVITQPTIKIEIWSRKAEIGLIGVWHNENLPQGTNTIGMSRMAPRSQLIFDKSDSVRSRTEEWKNHSHTLKLKNSEVIISKGRSITFDHSYLFHISISNVIVIDAKLIFYLLCTKYQFLAQLDIVWSRVQIQFKLVISHCKLYSYCIID